MNKSESIANLMAALVKAQAEFPAVVKSKEVIVNSSKGSYAFKYAPLEQMISTIRPTLSKYGLGFVQGANGDTLETTIIHESGEWITHAMPIIDPGTSQAYGATFTYRRRYGLKAALGIETDDDNSEMHGDQQDKRKPGRPSASITPTTGAWDGIDPERQEILRIVGGSVVDYFLDGQPEEAFRYLVGQIKEKEISNDERVAMWTLFDSKQRSALKRFAQLDGLKNGAAAATRQ